MKYQPSRPREIESNVALAWIEMGAIIETEYGEENTYYVNAWGHEFYCKNYPDRIGLASYYDLPTLA
jgi:hypothetical protein